MDWEKFIFFVNMSAILIIGADIIDRYWIHPQRVKERVRKELLEQSTHFFCVRCGAGPKDIRSSLW